MCSELADGRNTGKYERAHRWGDLRGAVDKVQ